MGNQVFKRPIKAPNIDTDAGGVVLADLERGADGQVIVGATGAASAYKSLSGDIVSVSSLGVVVAKKVGVGANGTVAAQAATATLTNTIAGKILTNTGASGAIVLTLPAAATMANVFFKVAVLVAQTIELLPATGEKVWLNGSGVASKYCLIAGTIGNFADIFCDGTDYFVVNYSGVVTKEA